MAKRCWLLKSEPEVYSIDDLKADGQTCWEGVRNYQARNFLRDEIKEGDQVLFYHSNAEPPGVAGIAEVVREGYPEPGSSQTKPQWFMVDIRFQEKFKDLVSLDQLRANAVLSAMLVLKRGMRLSVQPVDKEHFDAVCKMGRR